MTRFNAYKIRDAIKLQRESVTDEVAVKTTIIYPKWETLVEEKFVAEKAGFRFKHEDQLYKTRNNKQEFLENWVPGVSTGALFEAIDDEHSGDIDNPIPYAVGMAIEQGKYYSENGVIYLCIRSSGDPLYHNLSALIGIYVQEA